MRTLKKTLSLVLVVAMVLGLCVVGASAKDAVENFTDDYQKVGAAYQEAMGVLVGVGIIDGMTETALEPQGTYTREQAAKIIAYMLLGKSKADSLKCTVAPFDDVAASRWSAGYIAFCVEQGIIDGMTATTYEPTGTLTGFQWAKMLLCAIGFGVKGEFTGSSWSVNTALVAHKVNLFAGDLDGADHTALRREQAALYAFNALNTLKVAYSPNVTSYVFGIQGYETVNGIGSTLAKDVYDLKCATGIVVDVEGNGAGYTVLSKDYSTANVSAKIKADNDIDMMYHAANVWYTGTNTGVYTYDLAKTTTYKCQEIAAGTTAANTAKAKTLTIGDAENNAAAAYEAYLLDNSAVNAGSAFVKMYVTYGQLGYVDNAKKTVTAGGYNVAAANVRTDISNIKYGAPVIVVYTTSTTDKTLHGMYVYPATSTVGTVKSIAKENGVIVSVTLTDGTVLKMSSVRYNDNTEQYVIGNVYTFVLDTHGHIIYATRDYARTLWVYTGEWKEDSEHGAIISDRVWAHRFINVTSGEEKFFPIKDARSLVGGAYYDISVTPTSAGEYVANRVTKGQNTYAAGYIVDDFTIVQNSTNSSTYQYLVEGDEVDGTVYFDGTTVTFLVASGTGANMKVTPYTGIQAFKTAYNVATNGTMYLANTAMTVSSTTTGAWKADTIFVFETNLATTSRYVFIPTDIDENDWSSVTGDPASYYVTYNGAYLEGKQISVSFYENQLDWGTFRDGTLDRGFYVLTTEYTNGVPVYWLGERKDNTGNCYYQHVSLIDTGNATTHTWYLSTGDGINAGRFEARDGEVTIVDVTNPTHKVETLYYLWQYMNAHPDWSLAFTVNPDTNRVDYIYLVNIGWDAEVTVSLSNELKAAGWVIHKIGTDVMPAGTTSKTYYDDDAHALVAYDIDVVIYNEKLKAERTTTTTYTLDVNKNKAAVVKTSYLTDGYIGLKIDVDSMVFGTKTQNFEIGGLVIGDVTVSLDNSDHVIYGTAGKNTQVFEDVVLGSELSFTFCQKTGNFNAEVGKQYWTGKYIDRANNQWDITGTLWNNNGVSCVTATILPKLDGTATIQSGAWVGIPNP